MQLTLSNILQQMDSFDCYLWKLTIAKKSHFDTTTEIGQQFKAIEHEQEKEISKKKLEDTVRTYAEYNKSLEFEISCKKEPKGAYILGPIRFTLEAVEPTQTPQTPSLGAITPDYIKQLGYVSADVMNVQIQGLQLNNQLQTERLVWEFEKKQQESELKRKQEELDKERKELDKKANELESQSTKAGKYLGAIAGEFFKKISPDIEKKLGIGAVNDTDDEPDEMQVEAGRIAETIYEASENLHDLQEYHALVKQMIHHVKTKKTDDISTKEEN